MGGDPELEAAEAERREDAEAKSSPAEEDSEEDELSMKDAAALARRQKTLARRGIVLETKADVKVLI